MSIPVSIVLPAYKTDFLRKSIQSLLSQTYKDFELIIVNDNPGSEIKEIVAEFGDERIQYFENEKNIGRTDLIRNWNNCINYAQGEFLLMASDDDIYHEEYLENMILLTKKYPATDLFYCRIKYIGSQDEIIQISQPALEFETQIDFIYQRLFWNRKQALQEFFFRKSKLNEIKGFVNFPLAWYSDDATLALMASNGVAYSEKILCGMRMSGSNISSGDLNIEKKLSALKQYIKWLDTFLPSLTEIDRADRFMKQMLLKEYKPILNDVRLRYINKLPLKVAINEFNQLYLDHSYSKAFVYRQMIKRILAIANG